MKANAILVRFYGTELDSGTVLEVAIAKNLGKPTVVLRCDFRRLSGASGLTEHYNLMGKNWPRTIEVHFHSFAVWASIFAKERQAFVDSDTFQATMKAEMSTVQRSVEEIKASHSWTGSGHQDGIALSTRVSSGRL